MILNHHFPSFSGAELAYFRLKPGVTEEHLLTYSRQLETSLLSQQSELIAHFLLKGDNGEYADVILASTKEKAQEYCQEWYQNQEAMLYVDLMEADSTKMTFWSLLG